MNGNLRFRLFSALLPVVGLGLMVARGEVARRGSPPFRLRIAGYDPRDLLSGHYLNYRYDLDWQGESSCGPLNAGRPVSLVASCCVCLTRGSANSSNARQLDCGALHGCDGWLHGSELVPPQRYYVPEERAAELQSALGQRKASVDVTASPRGEAALGELYLDDRPWRDALGDR